MPWDEKVSTEDIVIYFAGRTEPLTIDPEPDDGDPEDLDDEGEMRTLLFIAEALVEETDFYVITDSSGETTFVRAREIAFMSVPEWVIEPRMHDDDEFDTKPTLVP